MEKIKQTTAVRWGILFLLLGTALVLVWLGPEERTLGGGIRSVYIHVGLVWTGMAAFGLAAALGLWLAATASDTAARWLPTVSRVGLLVYFAGIAASALASRLNWGAVFWQEPRMATAVNMLAVALIVQVLTSWLPTHRLVGLLHTGFFALLLWANASTRLVLHPDDPIGTSDAIGIRLTFWAVFVLIGTAVAWGVYTWQQPQN